MLKTIVIEDNKQNKSMRTIGLITIISSVFLANASDGFKKKAIGESYVDKYAKHAIAEMEYSGIPASITLAQGMFESGYGMSDLAKKSNNHFGIKCHDWNGKKTYHDDDEKGECFRVYSKVEESYRDHSEFLMTRSRYEFLFEYKKTDYKKWAKGLKKAGYATNPEYAHRLINLIELYELYQYDEMSSSHHRFADVATIEPMKIELGGMNFTILKSHEVKETKSRIRYVVAQDGDTYVRIAREFNMSLWQLHAYNDVVKKDHLKKGEFVFLTPKMNRYKGHDTVVFSQGESISAISQRMGLKLKYLLKVNPDLAEDSFIERGGKVRLKS